MDEKVEISLQRYDDLKDCQLKLNELTKQSKDDVIQLQSHIILFAKNIYNTYKKHGTDSSSVLNEAATKSGFTIEAEIHGQTTRIGDGTGVFYKIKSNG